MVRWDGSTTQPEIAVCYKNVYHPMVISHLWYILIIHSFILAQSFLAYFQNPIILCTVCSYEYNVNMEMIVGCGQGEIFPQSNTLLSRIMYKLALI